MDSIIIVFIAGLWIGLSKGGVGGPVAGPVLLPLLSQTMPVSKAVGLILPLLMIGDIFALRFYWREWEMHYIRLMLPLAVVGVFMGTFVLTALSDDALRRILGVITLLIVLYRLLNERLKQLAYSPRLWHGHLAGWISGFASALANAGGPPTTAYLLLQRTLSPTAFVGTITLFFFIINLLKFPIFIQQNIIDVNALLGIAWIFPVIPLGVWFGRRIIGRINRDLFEGLMIVLLVVASVLLLVR
ncbi:MAG: sulfite exporter TauE/SafE family protein [Anaerolineae bacterium]